MELIYKDAIQEELVIQ